MDGPLHFNVWKLSHIDTKSYPKMFAFSYPVYVVWGVVISSVFSFFAMERSFWRSMLRMLSDSRCSLSSSIHPYAMASTKRKNTIQIIIKSWHLIISKDRAQKTKRHRFHPILPSLLSSINLILHQFGPPSFFLLLKLFKPDRRRVIQYPPSATSCDGRKSALLLTHKPLHSKSVSQHEAIAAAIAEEGNVKDRAWY